MSRPLSERDDEAGAEMATADDLSSMDDPALSDQEKHDVDSDADFHSATGDNDNDEQEASNIDEPLGTDFISNRYRDILRHQADQASEDGSSVDNAPRRAESPADSMLSGPDDTPSVQGSLMSSPGSSVRPSVASRPGLSSPTPSFRPFDRRFQSRLSSSFLGAPSPLSRPSSPAFLSGHSRNVSLSSQLLLDKDDTEAQSPPWEVVRWTKLKKLSGQVFSEAGKRNLGSPTCLAVASSIILGTSKGIILIFDYNQNLKTIIGPGTKAVESGAITSVAVSADHSTVAGGHANGSIFTWETGRASRPFLTIPHLEPSQLQNRTEDGHLPGVAVTHLGFLGTRHTALVSSNDKGMAFSHLATRGTGALGRTVRTTRILGRYPNAPTPSGKTLKPSTVLAFSPCPLGNTERATDTMGLTAMLTPYLLVIVSTTPVAQTQHKSARPKDVAHHSTMTGCLSWFPAVKLKVPDPSTGSDISKVKLVYCWSNVLTVLDVDEIPSDNKDKPPSLSFKARSRWKCEEAIVAVQWLSRSVLVVLTITQRLIVLEDKSMRMTDGLDLMNKHIYHVDLFSDQLHSLVEQLDEEDTTMHGVVADAFYMSFKAYKGRLFTLGFNDVSIGSLSNWADRLIALMENGDYIGAIQLATSYFTGDSDKLTVGLPDDTELRHRMVRDKLMEIMSSSLKYAFGQRQKHPAEVDNNNIRDLAETCFLACQSMEDPDFLFDEVYEWYEDGGVEGIFLETLETYILDESIRSVPPGVVKALVSYYVMTDRQSRLEEMIVHMETATLDLDQTTQLCKKHGLYDALIYIWNQAIGDYITPLTALLTLLVPMMSQADYLEGGLVGDELHSTNTLKMFPYLSFTLTGRVYPTEEMMSDEAASKAKAEIYWFLFSGNSIAWPKGSGRQLITQPHEPTEPSFPYLRLILKYDAPSFLSVLNEAFEDSFLNDSPEKQAGNMGGDLPEEQIFGQTVDRQYIVSILLEIMNPNDYAPEDTIYLDMFIARNLPKFPQYLLFTGSTLMKVLGGLCHYPGDDLAEDAQLSAEYLLSVYQPPDLNNLMPLFREVGFYRILKRQYKADKQFGKLLQAHFEDIDDQYAVFDCLGDCLRPQGGGGLNQKQRQEVLKVTREHARDLIELDAAEAARSLAGEDLELHRHILDSADHEPEIQYEYLRALLEPDTAEKEPLVPADRDLIERYVRLMCKFDPTHVSDYVGIVQSVDLRLDALLPTMEETGVIDAVVVLMAQDGQVKDAMGRLAKHLRTLESALHGLLTGAEDQEDLDLQFAAEEILEALQKYVHVGIWLCQGQTKSSFKSNGAHRGKKAASQETLSPDEELWLSLIEAAVQVTRNLSSGLNTLAGQQYSSAIDDNDPRWLDTEKLLTLLRSLVQHTFTALLSTTSSSAEHHGSRGKVLTNAGNNLSFLRILRAFLTNIAASSPSLADLRAVLASIFAAYAYEESILRLSNRLLERSLFVNVKQSVDLRQRGWRPRGSTCEACGRRVWGPGVSGNVFEAWEDKQQLEERQRRERLALMAVPADQSKGKGTATTELALRPVSDATGKGKGKGTAGASDGHTEQAGGDGGQASDGDEQEDGDVDMNGSLTKPKGQTLGPLVVLACRHIYHQSCLDALQGHHEQGGLSQNRDYRCPVDG